MKPDVEKMAAKLREEAEALRADLGRIARPNPQDPKDWELKPEEEGELELHDELPDFLEAEEEREATEAELEGRLREIKYALDKVDQGRYGLCEICQQPISAERLAINPAARTCREHLGQETPLRSA